MQSEDRKKAWAIMKLFRVFVIVIVGLLAGCSGKKEKKNTISIVASPVPHAQMLRHVKPMLKEKGYDLEIIEIMDYNIPNRALAEKEVDANFFQHIPFMDEQIKALGYKIRCFAKIHLEPMAFYSKRYSSLKSIPSGGTITIPNDPTNEYRALVILQKEGLIRLREGVGLQATKTDIVSNPKNLKFREVDAAILPRTLSDADAAAIPTNFALEIDLNPAKDAIAIEDADSPYANIIAIRDGDQEEEKLMALRDVMLADEMRTFILDTYKGAIIPVLKICQ